MKSALLVALCFKPHVGGLGSAFAGWREQCRPEAWAVRGKASMPEAPLWRGGIATNDSNISVRLAL
jgi:hypothetical protein